VDKRTKASANLKALSNTLRDVLNEQCVLRQRFDDVARTLISRARQQFELGSNDSFRYLEPYIDCGLG
jgi:hypothetical protein